MGEARYTEAEIAAELEKLEEAFKALKPIVYGKVFVDIEDGYRPQWTYNRTYTTYANASNPGGGNATIELKCDTVISGGSQEFISISNVRTRQYGPA